MNFEIQALGGKLIGSRSAMKTLDRLTTLLPNAKINFEVLPPPETKKAEFGSMPDFRDPVSDEEEESEDEDDITIAELMWDIHNDITLADLTKQIIREENRLKKKKEKEQAVSSDEEGPFEFVDEMTYYSRSSEHLPNF